MNWTKTNEVAAETINFSGLDTPVGKTGSTESVLIVAIIWGIAIVVAAN